MSGNAEAIGVPLADLETPALCLDIEVYRRNVARMTDYIVRRHGLAWRPHIKGQKAAELAREAVAAGAIGVTCATLYEAEVMVHAGCTASWSPTRLPDSANWRGSPVSRRPRP